MKESTVMSDEMSPTEAIEALRDPTNGFKYYNRLHDQAHAHARELEAAREKLRAIEAQLLEEMTINHLIGRLYEKAPPIQRKILEPIAALLARGSRIADCNPQHFQPEAVKEAREAARAALAKVNP